MKSIHLSLLLALAVLPPGGELARAQDNVRGGAEPVVKSIDPAKLTYDYLVDGNLPGDDPPAKKFKTLQAAYAAAPAGTEAHPTVIGIRPNVYQLPGPTRGASLSITKNYITLLGLTDNRRTVVLADNRGLRQGSDDDGFIIDVNDTGFTVKNLTIINYCNEDYEYPGDPAKNLHRKSDVITQGVALQSKGDKHVYENVALLGRLDTMFLQTVRSYFKNVYIEGTDDWMGGGQVSVWEDCTLVYPTGSGVMSASDVIFINCRFEGTSGMEFYKAEYGAAGRPDVFINCVLPENSRQAPVALVRGIARPRPSQFTFTYHNKDTKGKPAVFYDSNVGPPTFAYSKEMSDEEVQAFNPWNLLRAPPAGASDNWDPAGVREKYEAAGQGNLPFRGAVTGGSTTVRTGGRTATLSASVTPGRADHTINWSTQSDLVSLSATTGRSVVVTAKNTTREAEWVAINAAASNGLCAPAYLYVEPTYIDPPAITAGPTLHQPAGGMVTMDYKLDLGGNHDQSLVTWYLCDNAAGANARKVAVSRGNQPLKSLVLTPGYVGKHLKVTLQPKHQISNPGPESQVMSASPIAAADVPSTTVSPNFRNFVSDANDAYVSGFWTVVGPWNIMPSDDAAGGGGNADTMLVPPDKLVNGYGIRPNIPGNTMGYLDYQQDTDCGDMQVDLVMGAEKVGTVFSVPGSPADNGMNNLHSDIFIKYDPRTKNGYAVRFWRTTQSDKKCMYQLYKIENGAGSPLNDQQVLSGVFKPRTRMTIKVAGTTLSVSASNDTDDETVALSGTITPNHFGGAGVAYPRGSSIVISRFEISYPGAGRAP